MFSRSDVVVLFLSWYHFFLSHLVTFFTPCCTIQPLILVLVFQNWLTYHRNVNILLVMDVVVLQSLWIFWTRINLFIFKRGRSPTPTSACLQFVNQQALLPELCSSAATRWRPRASTTVETANCKTPSEIQARNWK